MGCLFAVFGAFFPRLAVLFIWLARPVRFSEAFDGFLLWPLLGLICLPYTTLMYVIVWSPGVGLSGFDWFWLVLAAALDISSLGGSGYVNRDRVPRRRATD